MFCRTVSDEKYIINNMYIKCDLSSNHLTTTFINGIILLIIVIIIPLLLFIKL